MKSTQRLRLLSFTQRKRRCSAFLKRPSASVVRQKCFIWPTASSRAKWKWKPICLRESRNEKSFNSYRGSTRMIADWTRDLSFLRSEESVFYCSLFFKEKARQRLRRAHIFWLVAKC